MRKLYILLLLLLSTLFIGCDSPELIHKKQQQLLNEILSYISDVMSDAYLWYKQMPNLDASSYTDPKQFYADLLYSDDHWSYITDDATTLTNTLSGIETTFGYELAFYRQGTTDYVFAVVKYVNPGTPASAAGIQRGDIFVKLNNARITTSNYTDLIYSPTVTLTYADIQDSNLIESSRVVSLTAQKLNISPLQTAKVFDLNGTKVGYLHYTSFVAEYNDSLTVLFTQWKNAGVTEVVLDLRYNGGGSSTASTHLCSCLAPEANVKAADVLVYNQWNDRYDAYWRKNGYTNQYERRFDSSVTCNLNLSRLFVLTTKNSASASELTIVGLADYLNLIQIGSTTYGKYTSMALFQPKDEAISNWALLPIVAKYTSSKGVTDFKDGLTPSYPIDDSLIPATELGNPSEPLLAKALELIGGEVITTSPRRSPLRLTTPLTPIITSRITDNDIILFEE